MNQKIKMIWLLLWSKTLCLIHFLESCSLIVEPVLEDISVEPLPGLSPTEDLAFCDPPALEVVFEEVEPTLDPAFEPALDPLTDDPTEEPPLTLEPVPLTDDPADEPILDEPKPEPVPDIEDPIPEVPEIDDPTLEPVLDPVDEPVLEPPVFDPVFDPMEEPVVEPAPEGFVRNFEPIFSSIFDWFVALVFEAIADPVCDAEGVASPSAGGASSAAFSERASTSCVCPSALPSPDASAGCSSSIFLPQHPPISIQ